MKYLVLLPFWDCMVGPYESGLGHCTLMYWFQLGSKINEGEVTAKLDTIGKMYLTNGTVLVGSHKEHCFGPNGDVSVTVLQENNILFQIHGHLKQFLDERGCVYQEPRWVGRGFRPHVTQVKVEVFCPGARQTVCQIALLRADSAGRKDICHANTFHKIGRE